MALIAWTYGKYPLGHGEGGGVGNAFQTVMARVDWRDVKTNATFNLITLPAGAFVTRCFFCVETAFTSGDGATMQIDESSGNGTYILAAVGTTGNLSQGSVIKGHTFASSNDSVLATVLGDDAEFDTSVRTIDFVTGTGSWTAGVGVLVVEYIIIPQ